jgi:MoaA/NifB/PqqE/SkfB family radical SAM enzyme
MNIKAFLNTVSNTTHSLPLVILYVTAGCNLRCIMCSYRDPLPNELTLAEIRALSGQLSQLGLRHIVYSGGEPLSRRDLPDICEIFRSITVKQSLLTNGLLLQKRFSEIRPFFHEIIVSLDGPTATSHNNIRGGGGFDTIIEGIRTVLLSTKRPDVSIRTVIQKSNFREIGEMVELAKSLGVSRISFLPVDVSSAAFHRPGAGALANKSEIVLSTEETAEFRAIMEKFLSKYDSEIRNKFISEDRVKLMHIVQYFEACASLAPFPRNHCNAPMISAVITSTGDLLPCYFLPPFGNMRSTPHSDALNGIQIRVTRQRVREYSLQRCHECVCTLTYTPAAAFFDRF